MEAGEHLAEDFGGVVHVGGVEGAGPQRPQRLPELPRTHRPPPPLPQQDSYIHEGTKSCRLSARISNFSLSHHSKIYAYMGQGVASKFITSNLRKICFDQSNKAPPSTRIHPVLCSKCESAAEVTTTNHIATLPCVSRGLVGSPSWQSRGWWETPGPRRRWPAEGPAQHTPTTICTLTTCAHAHLLRYLVVGLGSDLVKESWYSKAYQTSLLRKSDGPARTAARTSAKARKMLTRASMTRWSAGGARGDARVPCSRAVLKHGRCHSDWMMTFRKQLFCPLSLVKPLHPSHGEMKRCKP